MTHDHDRLLVWTFNLFLLLQIPDQEEFENLKIGGEQQIKEL